MKIRGIITFIAELLVRYHWAYYKGLADGKKRSNYFTGYADGQEQAMSWLIRDYKKFFNNKDFRKKGNKK